MNRLLIACTSALAVPVAPCSAQTLERLAQIKNLCMKRYTDSDGTDWALVEFCIENQIEALRYELSFLEPLLDASNAEDITNAVRIVVERIQTRAAPRRMKFGAMAGHSAAAV